jgi:hypothetical protein
MMRHVILCLFLTGAAAADPIPAAGRIESEHVPGTCSAVLIAPDLVLTAAHCVGSDVHGISFRPGTGTDTPAVPLAATAIHPFYDAGQTRPNWKVRFDIRIARLRDAVPAWIAEPMPVGPPAVVGEKLFLVSWRKQDGALPRQRTCPVLEGLTGVVTLACSVSGGESGSPLLRATERGLELVAIVSSRSHLGHQPVALATDVALRLQPLKDALD